MVRSLEANRRTIANSASDNRDKRVCFSSPIIMRILKFYKDTRTLILSVHYAVMIHCSSGHGIIISMIRDLKVIFIVLDIRVCVDVAPVLFVTSGNV